MPTYRNNYGYSREFFDVDGHTVTLKPYETIDLEHEVDHPNLTLVVEETAKAGASKPPAAVKPADPVAASKLAEPKE